MVSDHDKMIFMQMKEKHGIYRLSWLAAVLALASVACNNSDNKTSYSSSPDSTKNLNPAASATPAGQPSTPTTHTAGIHNRKKAKATIVVTKPMAGAKAPEFPGGEKALDNYVNDHINYPQQAIDNDVSGVVRVSFIVDEQGRITKAKLVSPQKVGEGLDEEALRVVSNMPEWKPGTLHGRKVKTRLELPISFQVES
jgi:protein TonB